MQALKTLNVASAAAVAPRPAAVRRANAAAAPAASASAAASTSSSASSLRSAAPARRGLRSLPVASPQGNRSTTLARAAASSPPWAENDARLVLEDGSVWHGVAFGARASAVGEAVFNTSLTGYQEILTDPSYKGKFVVFTVPHIGNVGINPGEWEGAVRALLGLQWIEDWMLTMLTFSTAETDRRSLCFGESRCVPEG